MQGFLKAYDSVRPKVMAVSDEVMGGKPRLWQAYVTGHSLGGALATLCSYELANRRFRQQSASLQCAVLAASTRLPSLTQWLGAQKGDLLEAQYICADVGVWPVLHILVGCCVD